MKRKNENKVHHQWSWQLLVKDFELKSIKKGGKTLIQHLKVQQNNKKSQSNGSTIHHHFYLSQLIYLTHHQQYKPNHYIKQ